MTEESPPASATASESPATTTRPLETSDYPALFQVADARSIDGQRAYQRLIGIELAFVLFGAALGVLTAAFDSGWQVTALIAAGSFLAALTTRVAVSVRGDDRAWFDGRAVAESLKTQTWRYIMRVGPFESDDGSDAAFAIELTDILRARPSVAAVHTRVSKAAQQITPRMRAEREGGLDHRVRLYAEQRLDDQAEWYRRAASRHATASNRWSKGVFVAEALAVAVALAMAMSEVVAGLGLLGLFGSAAAAFTAWSQLGRHSEVSRAYGLAYQELLTMRSLTDRITTEDRLAELVDDGEAAISREHSMWVARRVDPLGRLKAARG